MASVLETIVFEPARFQQELLAFDVLLKSKADLSEMKDIQPFFKKNKHLTAYLGTFALNIGVAVGGRGSLANPGSVARTPGAGRDLLGYTFLLTVSGMHYQGRQHRRHSFDEPGHVHELTFSCYRRYRFLGAERTCTWLAQAIEAARLRWDFDLWAYVFMPEHVHLIVRPRGPGSRVSAILKGVKQPVGRRALLYLEGSAPHWLPRLTRERNGRVERLFWQPGGGYDRNLVEPRTLGAALSYVHSNPLRRGLTERASDWRWSSAGWYESSPKNDLRPDPIPPEWCEE